MHVNRAFLFFISALLLASCSHGAQNALIPPTTDAADVSSETPVATGASRVEYFPIGSSPDTDQTGFWIIPGPDGNLYYDTFGHGTCTGVCVPTTGDIGRFNPLTHAFHEISLGEPSYGLHFTPDGALWAAQYTGKLARLTLPLSTANVVEIPIPPRAGFPSPFPKVFTDGPDGNLWFVDQFTGRVGKINPAGPYTSAAISMYVLPRGPSGTPGLRAAPTSIVTGPGSNMWVADTRNGTIDEFSTGGTTLAQFITPWQQRLGTSDTSQPRFLARNGSYLYLTQIGTGTIGSFDRMTSSGGFAHIGTVPNVFPYFISSAGRLVAFTDLANQAIGLFHTDTGSTVELPATQLSQGDAGVAYGLTIASDGSVWFTCFAPRTTGGPLCLGHIVLTPVWSVLPSTTITLRRNSSGAPPQLIGIAESGNSGPFTVTSSNPNVVRVSALPSDHNFYLWPVGYVRAFVTVRDKNGRSQRLTVTVTK